VLPGSAGFKGGRGSRSVLLVVYVWMPGMAGLFLTSEAGQVLRVDFEVVASRRQSVNAIGV